MILWNVQREINMWPSSGSDNLFLTNKYNNNDNCVLTRDGGKDKECHKNGFIEEIKF